MNEYLLVISIFEGGGGESMQSKTSGRWRFPPTISTRLNSQWTRLTTLQLKVFAQRNFEADFLQGLFRSQNGYFTFLSPLPFEGLSLRGNIHSLTRLIGKHSVNFVLVIIELFSLGRVTAEALRSKINWKLPSFWSSGRRGYPTNHSWCQRRRRPSGARGAG